MKKAKPLSEEQIQQIVKMNELGWSTKEIYTQMGITKDQAYKTIRKKGLSSNCKKLFTPSDIELMKKLYLDGLTIQEIHEKHFKGKCTDDGINAVLRKLGVTRKNGVQAKIDHDYFEKIDDERKAYWVGFILADGSIHRREYQRGTYTNILRIELKISDKYLLEELAKDLKSDKLVKECRDDRLRGKFKPKHNGYITFSSKKIGDDLSKYGVVPNKTLKLKELPDIKKELMPHFIRGYFDGDGSVYINSKTKAIRTAFYGTDDFIKNIHSFLKEELNLRDKKIYRQKEAQVSFVSYAKEDSEKIYRYMYKESTICLKRKKELFESKIKGQ